MAGYLLFCLAVAACAPQRAPKGHIVPLKVAVQFEGAERAEGQTSNRLNAVAPDSSIGNSTLALIATATPTASTFAETMNRILTQPETLLSTGTDAFKTKRAFRWLAFKVGRGSEVLKSGSMKIRDPQVFDVAPIEFDAAIGDNISIMISLLQVDFMTASDADTFCQSGAPGLVRTWAGTSFQTVDEQGVMTVSLSPAGQTTVHMAAVGSSEPGIANLKAADLRHVIYDLSTGQQSEADLCRVFDLPAAETTPGVRFFKMMMLSQPLRAHALGLASLSSAGILLPKGSTAAWSTATDMRAAADLGVTLAARASVTADGSWEINRVLPTDLLGYSWLPIRPQITIGQPSLNVVNSTKRVEFPIFVSNGARVNLDNSKIIVQPRQN
ncbi:hypothetical protein EBR21_09640 [bacterium]|nr:hypothetical protein [bacterium]